MTFDKSNKEYEKIKNYIIRNCNVIHIDENDFSDLDYIVDIISLDYKNSNMNFKSAKLKNSKKSTKIIVSIVSNTNLSLYVVDNILTSIKLKFKHSKIILGIGENNNFNDTFVTMILVEES